MISIKKYRIVLFVVMAHCVGQRGGLSYMRYEVEAVHVDGSKDQTGHEDHQAERQAAQAVEGGLLGPQWQDELILILGNQHKLIL